MALTTYPLNNIEYSAEDAELFHVTRTSGIYAKDSFDYSLTGADNTIIINTGIGWIKNSEFSGKVIAQKEAISLDMGLSDSVYPRIDAIIIQFDANKNETNVVVKNGVAASSPVAPSVIRTESVYELHLYHVRREAGSLAITPGNITDIRLNGSYCGLMADSVTSIDTVAIEKQVSNLIKTLQSEISNVKDGSAYLLRDGSNSMENDMPMDGHKITGLGAPVSDTDATTKEYVDKTGSPYNLLDNSDFLHFVAQAGIGGTHGNQAYAGDRWILDSGEVTGEKNANGDGYSNITLNGTIRQIVANPPTGDYACGIDMVSGTATIAYSDGEVTITSGGGVIRSVKLVDGNLLPDYMPKGYETELAECQRYFYSLRTSMKSHMVAFASWAFGEKVIRVSVPLPEEMRISPTVTIGDISNVNFSTINGAGIGSSSFTATSTLNNRVIVLEFSTTSAVTLNTPVIARFNTIVIFNADL